jgi:malonyl CoA-acyl carrier protein transacylase
VFALEDALWVVSERARLIEAAPDGRMLAVAASAEQVRGLLAGAAGAEAGVDVAAVNGPTMTVVSGTPAGVAAAALRFAEAGIAARPLRSAHPFHSSLLAPARDKLAAVVGSVPRQAPRIRILSNATGSPLSAEQATDPWYWADHLTHPVLFAAAIQATAAQGVDAFVELGAGQMLGGLVRQNAHGGGEAAVLGTLPAQWQANGSTDERTALLETTGRLWELGVELDWAAVRSGGGKLIALPAYPFQRERFWPAGPARSGAAPEPSTGPAVADHCYAPTWRRDVTSAAAAGLREPEHGGSPFPAGSLLVFSDGGDGVGARLAARAAASGMYVLEVIPGTGFRREGTRVEIDPAEPEHYRRVCAELGAQDTGVMHVAHLWSLLDPGHAPVLRDEAELRTAIRHGYDSVLMTVQALGSTASNREVRLLTVTAGAAEVLGGDCPSPDRALAHGFGRAVQAEYPWLSWRGLDLDPAQEPGGPGADRLAAEIAAELREGPDVVARRGGRRWLRDWEPVPLPEDASAPAPYRADGVYLITGGTRGLGLGLARHLVRHGVRRLALVGRTDLRARAAAEPDGRAAQSLRQIAALEAAGARILLLTADAGVPEELRAAFRSCRDHFGALTGVFHAAGIQAGGMAYRQSPEGAARTLAPKVLAMGPLAELVGPAAPAGERPELLVLYSSAVTVFGGIGESDYCAANSVLDAYGAALADLAPSTRVLAVAWGPWQHDDWQANGPGGTFADRVRAHRETYGFDEADGCVLLDRLVAGARGGVVALRQSLAEGRRQWGSIIDLDTLAATGPRDGGETARAARFPRPRLRTEYAAPRTEVEALVAESWGHHLGIDRVGVHDPFFELGGNSLIGLAMVADVGRRLDRPIAPAVLFEHPTVAEFAASVGGAPADPGAAGRALGSARGERRRRGRAAAGTPTASASPAN